MPRSKKTTKIKLGIAKSTQEVPLIIEKPVRFGTMKTDSKIEILSLALRCVEFVPRSAAGKLRFDQWPALAQHYRDVAAKAIACPDDNIRKLAELQFREWARQIEFAVEIVHDSSSERVSTVRPAQFVN